MVDIKDIQPGMQVILKKFYDGQNGIGICSQYSNRCVTVRNIREGRKIYFDETDGFWFAVSMIDRIVPDVINPVDSSILSDFYAAFA